MAKKPFEYDKGWGWVVVLGSFLIHMICDGITYSFGVIMVELEDTFHGSNFLNSWIVSILIGFTLGSGPIAGAFANRFGCRSVSIVGAIIAAFGSFISAWAANIPHLIISVGVIMGTGFGLMFCPSVLIVNMYFEQKRAVAIGIAVCGAGVGTFVFSPLSEYLMGLWGWRGCFIVYSGIILNGVVCASVFRPVVITHVLDLGESQDPSEDKNGRQNHKEKSKEPSPIMEEPEGDETTLLNGNGVTNHHHNSLKVLNNFNLKRPHLLNQIVTSSDSRLKSVGRTVHLDETKLSKRFRSETFCVGTPSFTEKQAIRRRVNGHDQIEVSVHLKPLELKDIFLYGSVKNLPKESQVPHPHQIFHQVDSHPVVPQKPSGSGDLAVVEETSIWTELRRGMAEMTDFSILRDPIYLLFAVSNFLTNIGYDLPRVFLPTYAEPLNIGRSESPWLVSAWGIANTVGRVFVGWLADRRWALGRRLWIYNLSLVICGIVNFAAPLCRDFPSLLIYSALFGFTLSTYISLTSVVLVDLLGLEKLTSAYGILLFFQGVAAVVGTPIGGLIMDVTGVQSGFIFAGVVLAASGLMLFPIPCLKRYLGRPGQEGKSSKQLAIPH